MFRTLTLLFALSAGEGAGAIQALQARDQEIRAQLPPAGQEVSPEARAKADAVLTRLVDVDGIAKAALGDRWTKLSGKDRARFLSAFERRFKQAIGEQLDAYRSANVTYGDEKKQGNKVLVSTQLQIRGEPTEVTYAMQSGGKGWRIVDIVIDGVSTVDNYRTSFAKVISQEGINGLIERLSKGSSAAGSASTSKSAKQP